MTSRECPGCKRTLPATTTYFSVDRALKSGLKTRCRRCVKDGTGARVYNRVVDGMKVCPGCARSLPYTLEFYSPRTRKQGDRPDLQPRCKECRKGDSKTFYEDNQPHMRSMANRRYKARVVEDPVFAVDHKISSARRRAKIYADPEKLREQRDMWRMEAAAERRSAGVPARGSRVKAPPGGEGGRLDVEPLRRFLMAALSDEWDEKTGRARRYNSTEPPPRTFEQASVDVGYNERNLRDMLQGRTSYVTLGVADRILCATGCPHLLYEFWPHLRTGYLQVGEREATRVILPYFDALPKDLRRRVAREFREASLVNRESVRTYLTARVSVAREPAEIIWTAIRDHWLGERGVSLDN